MRRNTDHAYKRIGADLKTGKFSSVVLLWGSEEYLVDFYANVLIRKFVNGASAALDLVTINREDVTPETVMDNLETLPVMSERKVVCLPRFFDSRGKVPKHLAEGSGREKELADYIREICSRQIEGMLLVITCAPSEDSRAEQEMKKNCIFTAACAGSSYDFNALDDSQLRGFIEKRFRTAGKQFRPGIASYIVRESGYGNKNVDYGLYSLDNDLKKIIAHSGSRDEILREDVEAALTVSPENNVFAMIDAMGRKRKDEAFRLLNNLLEDGSGEFQLLALIVSQLELMLTSCEMKGEGMTLPEIQKSLKKSSRIHEYRTQKAMEAGSRFGVAGIKSVLSSAYMVEYNVKTGLMPGRLALEYFIAGI